MVMSDSDERTAASYAACGGLKICEEVEVDGSQLQGYVLDLIEATGEVIVDHGLYTRVYHHLELNYPD